jgi:flavin reductase (DIM6/NTAB) family NADH-FMN oxidoreductase RutF
MMIVVVPPIWWTSTISRDGRSNPVPFSFFMMISSTPPHVAISVGPHDGQAKVRRAVSVIRTSA